MNAKKWNFSSVEKYRKKFQQYACKCKNSSNETKVANIKKWTRKNGVSGTWNNAKTKFQQHTHKYKKSSHETKIVITTLENEHTKKWNFSNVE